LNSLFDIETTVHYTTQVLKQGVLTTYSNLETQNLMYCNLSRRMGQDTNCHRKHVC